METMRVLCGVGDHPPVATFHYGPDCLNALDQIEGGSIDLVLLKLPPYAAAENPDCDVAWKDRRHSVLSREPHPDIFIKHVVEVVISAMRCVHPTGQMFITICDSSYIGDDEYDANIVARLTNRQKGQAFNVPAFLLTALDPLYCVRPLPVYKRNPPPPSTHKKTLVSAISWMLQVSHVPYPFLDPVNGLVPTVAGKPAGNKNGRRVQPAARGTSQLIHSVPQPVLRPERILRDVDISRLSALDEIREYVHVRNAEGQLKGDDFFLLEVDGYENIHPIAYHGRTTAERVSDVVNLPKAMTELMVHTFTSEKGVCPVCRHPWVRTLKHREWHPSCPARRDCGPTTPVRPKVLDIFSGGASVGRSAVSLGRDYIGIDFDEGELLGACCNVQGGGLGRPLNASAIARERHRGLGDIGAIFGGDE